MSLSELDRDGRRLVTRANELIERQGLGDEYGGKGGLIAEYNPSTWTFYISDEATCVTWNADDKHILTQKDWDDIWCWIMSFTPHGCSGDHEHYTPF